MTLFAWSQPLRNRPVAGYCLGLLLMLCAYSLRLALPDVAARFPFIIFLPPVIIVTFLGGTGPGIATALLGGFIVDVALIAPVGSFMPSWPVGWIALAFYTATVALYIWLIHGMADAVARARDAEGALRELNRTLEDRVAERTAVIARQAEEREAAEDKARQMQKMEALGQLTGGVAHDFNNLLTIIKSSVELLGRPNLSDERRARYIDAISTTADRAAKLTHQLLAFARRQPLTPILFDVDEKVEALVPMLTSMIGPQVRITVKPGARHDLVEVDLSQFETALINMAVNARDAMPRGGWLTITIDRTAHIPATRAHAAAPGDYVTVEIKDTGRGMAPETMARIFEPFYTTKAVGKGTGLGLSQVYGFAKQSSGEVVVSSTPDAGTTFTMFLPRAVTILPLPDAIEPSTELDEVAGCILLVEDNQLVGEFATQLLEDMGYRTLWAPNAQVALDDLELGAERFDAVFSDVVMPGMSGIDLALELRRNRPRLPVILTSGYSQAIANEGTHGFELLQKPYTASKVMEALRRAIATRDA